MDGIDGSRATEGIDDTLSRIASIARVVAAVWMAVLGIVALVNDGDLSRPGVVVAAIALSIVWASVARLAAARGVHPLASTLLTADLVVAVSAVGAAWWADASAFYGALPLIVVAIAAFRSRATATATAGVLVVVVLATAGALSFGQVVGQLTSVFAYLGAALLVSWIVGVLRAAEADLLAASDAVAAARTEAARAAERADIGRHLHDSVLQSLALIQRESGDRQAVTTIARRQERELRQWLFGLEGPPRGFEEALRSAAGGVEERFGVSIDVVVVGSAPPSDPARKLVDAAAEAMANAAEHAGVGEFDVYGEALGGALTVYVRDRGSGFDPEAIPSDRRGLRESIVGRMESIGGAATVRTSRGEGTEWVLSYREDGPDDR